MMQGDRSINSHEATRYGFPARSGWLIARTNAYGIVTGHQLRPHNPPEGTGKYLWAAGSEMQAHIPITHIQYVRDLDVDVAITESILKANSMASAETDVPILPVGISGVWGFRGGGGTLDDLKDDIRVAHKKRGHVVKSRRVILVPDSDVRDNPKVTEARRRHTSFLQRQGADVYWIDLPHAPDGTKQGVDDVLASGVSLATILGWAKQAPRVMPIIDTADPPPDSNMSEVERLRAENTKLKRDNAELVRLATNPHLKEKAKVAAVRLATIARSKASLGKDMDGQGCVRISAGEISQDFRPRVEKGERQEPTNPDGSSPLMTRGTVKRLLEEMRDTHQVLDFKSVDVRKTRAANGLPYYDTEFLVTPAPSLAEALRPLAWFAPATPSTRTYRRQEPCPSCGQIHSRTIVCDGCGAPVKHLPLPPEQDPDVYAASQQRVSETPPVDIETGEILEEPSIAENFDAMGSAPVNPSAGNIHAMDEGPPDEAYAAYPSELLDPVPTNTYGHDRWAA